MSADPVADVSDASDGTSQIPQTSDGNGRRSPRTPGEMRSFLRSALICDALDVLGVRDAALSSAFRPLDRRSVLVGRAFPIATVSVDRPPTVPYEGLLRALDALSVDDVYVISAQGRLDVSLWGELLTTASLVAGAAGVVCAGTVRDTERIRAMGFPCFSYGAIPYDINGRLEIAAHGVPVEIESRLVHPGQLIVADADGVVVVPFEHEAAAVEAAFAKAAMEREFRGAVDAGIKPSDAFARYGVL